MTTPRLVRAVTYFSIFTLLVGAIMVALMYYAPSPAVVTGSVVYGFVFIASTAILLIGLVAKAVSRKGNRRAVTSAMAWLLLNSTVAVGYFKVWVYAADTVLIKITNNTGYEVTEAGIYGCFAQSWGRLANGERRTVRFPVGYDCAFEVTYKLRGLTRREVLPRQTGVTNDYALGANANNAVDTMAANTGLVK